MLREGGAEHCITALLQFCCEGKKRGKNKRQDHENSDTTSNWLIKQSNCQITRTTFLQSLF